MAYNVMRSRIINREAIGQWGYHASSDRRYYQLEHTNLDKLALLMAEDDHRDANKTDEIDSRITDEPRIKIFGYKTHIHIGVEAFVQDEVLTSNELAFVSQKYLLYYNQLIESKKERVLN
ncbi:hypothetical protein J4221_05790 [Candidatus Pacearchaeota archaeon]|nr:hypothetical protein [Candidatus Pacearchaeota archaeon]